MSTKKIEDFTASDRIDIKLLESNCHYLTGELDEENIIPTVLAAAINETDTELNHIVVDGEPINLFGTITDTYNDVDDIDADGIEDDILYNWNYVVVPNQALTINNANTLNNVELRFANAPARK